MKLKPLFALLLITCFYSTVLAQQKDFHQWAETPPTGWNSWDCFGPTVVESEVKGQCRLHGKKP